MHQVCYVAPKMIQTCYVSDLNRTQPSHALSTHASPLNHNSCGWVVFCVLLTAWTL